MMRFAVMLLVALAHTCSPLPSRLGARNPSHSPSPHPSTYNGDTQPNEILQHTISIHKIMFQFNSTEPPSKESVKILDQLSSLLNQLSTSIDETFESFDGVEDFKRAHSSVNQAVANTANVIERCRSGESFQGELQGAFQDISLETIKLLEVLIEGQGEYSGSGNPATHKTVPVSDNLRGFLKDLTELWQSARNQVEALKMEYYIKQFPGISHLDSI